MMLLDLHKFLTLIFLICHISDSTTLIWPCEIGTDCNSVENAICSQYGSCVCPSGFVFSTNLTQCIVAVLYGDPCNESVQCSYMPTGASCTNGVCQCDEGFTYIQGRCKILSPLNGFCEKTTDCQFGSDRESVVCKNKKCICSDQYYQRSENICRRKSINVGDACIVDSDCDYIKNLQNRAKCDKFQCVEAKSKYNNLSKNNEISVQISLDDSSRSSKSERNSLYQDDENNIELSPVSNVEAKKYGESCSNIGEPCENLHHSICVESICVCRLGYYNKNGICMAELGEEANNEALCHTEETTSPEYRNSVCVCPINYHYDSNLRSCKKPIPLIGSCTSNVQCTPFGAAYCNTSSFPKKCACHIYANLNEKNQLCELKTGLGSICKENADCNNRVQHSVCSTEKLCKCKSRFIEKNDICLPGIGGECMTNDDCAIENSNCVTTTNTESNTSSSCQCKKGFVHFEVKCLKEAKEYGDECLTNDQCKALLGNLGKCEENKCTCDPNHHLSYGKCEQRRSIGEGCLRLSQCYTPENSEGVECKNEVCKCQLGYTHDPVNHICIKPRSNKSSGRSSLLKRITFILNECAFFVVTAVIKQAYYA